MSHQRILELVDLIAAEKDSAKKLALAEELRKLLDEDKARKKAKAAKASG